MSRTLVVLLLACALDARAASILVTAVDPLEVDIAKVVRIFLVLDAGEEAVGFSGSFDIEGPVYRTTDNYGSPFQQPWQVSSWSVRPTSPHVVAGASGPYSNVDPQPEEWTSAAGPLRVAGFTLVANGPGEVLVRAAGPIYRIDRVGPDDVQVLVAQAGDQIATLQIVPEPGSAALLTLGLGALALARVTGNRRLRR